MRVNKPYTNKQYADLAVFCNHNDCHIEDKGDYLESVANIHLPPTNEEQRINRAKAYVAKVDPLHAQKLRHIVIGDWTEEDEAEYVEKVKTLSEEINNEFPYMENDEESVEDLQ